MISRILALSIQHRWIVVVLALVAVVLGAWSLARLPIDAVPDITNKQVQVNTTAPALSPAEIEKQVTLRIETALAGIPGLESTRSISRNGFSQVTAVFTERTDIYFARQQVNERLLELRPNLPPGVEPKMGPISTGLGEIYMWTVGFRAQRHRMPAAYVTPEGERLTTEVERGGVSAHGAGLDHPAADQGRARCCRRRFDRRLRQAVPRPAGSGEADRARAFVCRCRQAPSKPTMSAVAPASSNATARASRFAPAVGSRRWPISARWSSARAAAVPVRVRDVASVAIGGEIRTGSASENGHEVVVGTALMLVGSNSRTVAAAVDARIDQVRRTLPAGIEVKTVLNRTQLVDSTIETVATNLGEGAFLVILVLFLLLGNFRAAFITALVIPVAMLMTATGMLQGRISANLMSLGALDFGLIVDGAVIITENALRHLAERQAAAGRVAFRFRATADGSGNSAEEMIGPSVYGQAIIILVYLPLLTFSGVEGKMFEPMALTVILALDRGVRAFADAGAGADRDFRHRSRDAKATTSRFGA